MRLAFSLLAASEEMNLLRLGQWVGASLRLDERPTQLFQIKLCIAYFVTVQFLFVSEHLFLLLAKLNI